MKILLGETRKKTFVAEIERLGWGRLMTVNTPNPYPGEPWGFDNGAFVAWRRGESFPEEQFLRRLDRAYKVGIPYLAVCPDIVAGGMASLDFSIKWLERLPKEWPWYLAVQDGMTYWETSILMQKFAGVFLGGSDAFKATAKIWRDLAFNAGMKFHYGRAGYLRRIRHALWCKADSLDSASPLWTKTNFSKFIKVIQTNGASHPLLIEPEESYVTLP